MKKNPRKNFIENISEKKKKSKNLTRTKIIISSIIIFKNIDHPDLNKINSTKNYF